MRNDYVRMNKLIKGCFVQFHDSDCDVRMKYMYVPMFLLQYTVPAYSASVIQIHLASGLMEETSPHKLSLF